MPADFQGTLSVPRSARWFGSGQPDGARERWFVLHGYGQLAEPFLHDCAVLAAPNRVVVAPEGLSRFYTKGMSEAPGASWMTREARDLEIADQIAYLGRLDRVIQDRIGQPSRTVVLGFSQGAAAAARWVVRGGLQADRLICWAGGVPLDETIDDLKTALSRTRLTLVYGTRDPLVTPDRLESMGARLHELAIPHDIVRFDGGHRLDDATLRSLAND